jgi:Ca2+-binding RTX toxin-like protein
MEPIYIEAEQFSLNNYQVEYTPDYIVLTGSGVTGTANLTFGGATGAYKILVGYRDEADGAARLSVKLNGNLVDSWILDQSNGYNTRTVADGIYVTQGSLIQLEGIQDAGEFARVDYVGFIPVALDELSAPRLQLGAALPDIKFNFKPGKPGLRLEGTDRAETLIGKQDKDILKGLARKDQLLGHQGNDRLLGGKGSDRLFGGSGEDRLVGNEGNDQLSGNGNQDRLVGGTGDDLLKGGGSRDLLKGGDGNDTLIGGNGDDILIGGSGSDILTGGKDKDSFKFNTIAEGGDRITDFNTTDDVIDLRPIFATSAFSSTDSANQFMQFIQLAQIGANTEVRIDADGNGIGTAFTTIAILENIQANTVSSASFVIS